VNDVNFISQFCATGISQLCGVCRHMLCDVVGEADRRIVLMIATGAFQLQGQRITTRSVTLQPLIATN
jgi:TPP-dependent 2-oxoacid decarboxylase